MKTWTQIIQHVQKQKIERNWTKLYWCIDLHDTIITGKYKFIINTDKGAEGAIKIANERRIRMIAENKWPKKGLTPEEYEPTLG